MQQSDLFNSHNKGQVAIFESDKKPPVRLHINLLSGLDRDACTKEAVLYVRMLQGKFKARGQKKHLTLALLAEADIKTGQKPAHLIIQDLFLKTLFKA